MAALTKNQQIFRDQFAKETGLDRKFVGAWLLAEQSGDAAKWFDRKKYYNFLNIGNTDSLVASGGLFPGGSFKDPRTAAKISAQWMRGKGPLAKSYGRPAAGITRILSTAGKGAEAQIRALSTSGWASSGYNGGNTLRQLMRIEHGGAKNTATGSVKTTPSSVSRAVTAPERTRTVTEATEQFDEAGYERARRQAALKGVLRQTGGMKMLAGLLPDAADPAAFTQTVEKTRTERVPDASTSPSRPRASRPKSTGTAGIPGLKGKGSGIYELFHDPVGGWKGQQNIGSIGGHGGHVHVAAGEKTTVGLGKLAQQMGLTVGENPNFGSGRVGKHTTNSHHYRRQAIDVTGDAKKLRQYTERIKRIYGLK